VIAAALVGFVWGELSLAKVRAALVSSTATYGVIGFVILGRRGAGAVD
jgi:hypothetical protein